MTQIYTGTIIALKNVATATVEVVFNKIHPKYLKPFKRKRKFQVHYKTSGEFQIGDKVVIRQSKPYSKTKKFLLLNKI